MCEILNRTIQSIWDECGSCPSHVVLQSDNTTSFSKNSVSHLWLALCVSRGYFSTATVNYLTKGHTHEDVDAFLAELLPSLRRNAFNNTTEVVDFLKRDLARKTVI